MEVFKTKLILLFHELGEERCMWFKLHVVSVFWESQTISTFHMDYFNSYSASHDN